MPVYDLGEKRVPETMPEPARQKGKAKKEYWQTVTIRKPVRLTLGQKITAVVTGEVTRIEQRERAGEEGRQECAITLHSIEIGGKGSDAKARGSYRRKAKEIGLGD